MIESEWLKAIEPSAMLAHIRESATDRKLCLFACACCRNIWELMSHECCRHAVEIAEKYAEGQIHIAARIFSADPSNRSLPYDADKHFFSQAFAGWDVTFQSLNRPKGASNTVVVGLPANDWKARQAMFEPLVNVIGGNLAASYPFTTWVNY